MSDKYITNKYGLVFRGDVVSGKLIVNPADLLNVLTDRIAELEKVIHGALDDLRMTKSHTKTIKKAASSCVAGKDNKIKAKDNQITSLKAEKQELLEALEKTNDKMKRLCKDEWPESLRDFERRNGAVDAVDFHFGEIKSNQILIEKHKEELK